MDLSRGAHRPGVAPVARWLSALLAVIAGLIAGTSEAAETCDLAAITAVAKAAAAMPTTASVPDQPPKFAAAPALKLRDPVLKLDNGATDGGCPVMFLEADGGTQPVDPAVGDLKDLGIPTPVTIEFRAVPLDSPGPTTKRTWLIVGKVGKLAANSAQSRILTVAVGGRSIPLPYTLTNKSVGTFSWTVKPLPAEISFDTPVAIEVTITVGPVAATEVKLTSPPLLEKSRKWPFDAAGFQLCRQPSGGCELGRLEANAAHTLWLRPASGEVRSAGQFAGQVTISAAEKPEGDTLPLTIFASTCLLRWLGVLVILASVVGTWWVSTFARNRLNRDQMLQPAVDLSGRLKAMKERLAAHKEQGEALNTNARIDEQLATLNPERLTSSGLLPRLYPIPWAVTVPSSDTYQQVLKTASDWTMILSLLMRTGFEEVWGMSGTAPANVKIATGELDAQVPSPTLPTADKVAAGAAAAVTKLRNTLAGPVLAAAMQRAAAVAAPGPMALTSRELSVEITRLSVASWLFTAVTTTALGSYILIYTNLGFGLPGDFLLCLFWGVGLPLGTQQLAQLGAGNVATTLGITVPR